MEDIIKAVANALARGLSIEKIHDAMVKKGWNENDIFLAIKAGEIIYQSRLAMEEEKKNNPPKFNAIKVRRI